MASVPMSAKQRFESPADSNTCSSSTVHDPMHSPAYEATLRGIKVFTAGATAGAVSRTLTAPIDRVKLLMQCNSSAKPIGAFDVVRQIHAEGTVKAFFRGNGANVLKIAPEHALKFSLNDVLKHVVCMDPNAVTPYERLCSGALAGACAQLAVYPMEVVRTRMTVCAPGSYRGVFHTATSIFFQEGPRAFYRGLLPSTLGMLPYSGVDIMLFETLNERLKATCNGPPLSHVVFAAGMLSSSMAQIVAYPFALVRTRLQAEGMGGRPPRYKGMLDVFQKTLREEGFRGFYKGLLPNMFKVAPAAGISWLIFEQMKHILGVQMR